MSSHDATFYVQVEPEWSRYPDDSGNRRVRLIKAVGITQRWPNHPRRGTITAKLTLRIPDAAFLPLRPEAIVVVPEEMTAVNPIEVEAEEPEEEVLHD